MTYYYTNTGHKIGLERLRRGAALLNRLAEEGEEIQLLVNDFRAGLVARELGVKEYVTIEGVQDIDAIAENGANIIIDSMEDDHGRLVKYCEDFAKVWRYAHDANDSQVHTEILMNQDTILVDDVYFDKAEKTERVLFFLGDSDSDKMILNNASFFENTQMELLLGNYFFVKYEDDLAKLFTTLHEPEEYESLIQESTTIVTASMQTAFEAKVSEAKVIFLDIHKENLYDIALLEAHGIAVVKGYDKDILHKFLNENISTTANKINKIEVTKVLLNYK